MTKGIVIAGPTAVGKTGVSLFLAEMLGGEIISADSAQIYRGLDIGTAKITTAERRGVPHHMIDVVDLSTRFTAGDYARMVAGILSEGEAGDKPMIMTGGSGLYIRAVADGFAELPPGNPEIRKRLAGMSPEVLYGALRKHDPEAAAAIHANNRKRVERALEVFLLTGKPFSEISKNNRRGHNWTFLRIFLHMDRDALYAGIDRRVDEMMARGFVQEVEKLRPKYSRYLRSLNIIGYTEILDYLAGAMTLPETVELIKKNSRHYAKRQFSWFVNDAHFTPYDRGTESDREVAEKIAKMYKM
ncbi:MAG: tRNA (adenosine(37)-N6)-dimethylallyltransferase MiaA [Fusobacteriaceae bacterium]|jgi:tRNA dimethylallyltransferase|nr:tRNA (adenosine(37)-N6)-dimethylallyltransferase MiaA [Fusobacteriaceae bacterium]